MKQRLALITAALVLAFATTADAARFRLNCRGEVLFIYADGSQIDHGFDKQDSFWFIDTGAGTYCGDVPNCKIVRPILRTERPESWRFEISKEYTVTLDPKTWEFREKSAIGDVTIIERGKCIAQDGWPAR